MADSWRTVAPAVAEVAAPVEGETPGVVCGNRAGTAFPWAGEFARQGSGHLGVERVGTVCRDQEWVLWIWGKGDRSAGVFFLFFL